MPNAQKKTTATDKTKRVRKREGTKRDLFIGLTYIACLMSLLVYAGVQLCQWKTSLDNEPSQNCYNPVWSNQTERLAFLQTQPELIKTGRPKCSLWTVDKLADSPSMTVKDLDAAYRIIGWFGGDDIIILRDTGEKASKLTLMTVKLSDRSINKYTFNDASIKIIGKSANELFMQRNLHNAKLNADEIELLTWSPEKPELTKITAIPNRPSVSVDIDSVTPNLTANYLALVLRSIPKATAKTKAAPPALPPGAKISSDNALPKNENAEAAENGSMQYSVWILNRLAKRLTWTNFSAADPKSVFTSWSNDTSKLTCVANYAGHANLALYQKDKTLKTVRLRTFEKEGELIPQMRSDKAEVHLISNERILQYNFSDNSSSILADRNAFKLQPTFITLANNSPSLALTAHPAKSTQLYLGALNHTEPKRVNLDGKNAPPTLYYEIASALQCAWSYWQ